MNRKIILAVFSIPWICHLHAQNRMDSLFGTQTPLKIGLSIFTKELRDSKKDSTYISHILYYQNASGINDSIKVALRSRGNFRLKECYFPPLSIKIKKNDAKGTLFAGNKKIKLVLPCRNNESSNTLVLKEFVCYKLYEEVTPFSFRTRLTDIDLTELEKKRNAKSKLKGIFIEDLDITAGRLRAKSMERVTISPSALNDTIISRFELFQFMISNTDWSVVHQHNCKLIVQDQDRYIAIPYDFDMSGLVDAHYATVSHVNGEKLDAERVTDRVFRGYCHSAEVMQLVRQEFLGKKDKLLAVPDQMQGILSDREIKKMKNYLQEFFDIISNDRLFKIKILNKCRAN
jgi:hypothetical protein